MACCQAASALCRRSSSASCRCRATACAHHFHHVYSTYHSTKLLFCMQQHFAGRIGTSLHAGRWKSAAARRGVAQAPPSHQVHGLIRLFDYRTPAGDERTLCTAASSSRMRRSASSAETRSAAKSFCCCRGRHRHQMSPGASAACCDLAMWQPNAEVLIQKNRVRTLWVLLERCV